MHSVWAKALRISMWVLDPLSNSPGASSISQPTFRASSTALYPRLAMNSARSVFPNSFCAFARPSSSSPVFMPLLTATHRILTNGVFLHALKSFSYFHCLKHERDWLVGFEEHFLSLDDLQIAQNWCRL